MSIKTKYYFTIFLGIIFSFNAFADTSLLKRSDVRHFINYMVKHDDFNRADLIAAMKEAKFKPQIIESMEKPYEKKNWDVYKSLFVTPSRVKEGMEYWQAHAATLARAQKEYGVPAEIIVAILGVETKYGKRQGEYRVLDALTTLAFYYPKRSKYFTQELREYFLLCKEHKVSPVTYIGSYAGAIGEPQFMPSNYRTFAVDFAGHGYRDLVNDHTDSIGSVGNFFKEHGWVKDASVADLAILAKSNTTKFDVNAKQPNYAYKKLITSGVKPVNNLRTNIDKAGLVELVTDKGMEYWLAYHNFYVITKYNTSPQYALAVYLLANQLREARMIALKNQSNARSVHTHAYV